MPRPKDPRGHRNGALAKNHSSPPYSAAEAVAQSWSDEIKFQPEYIILSRVCLSTGLYLRRQLKRPPHGTLPTAFASRHHGRRPMMRNRARCVVSVAEVSRLKDLPARRTNHPNAPRPEWWKRLVSAKPRPDQPGWRVTHHPYTLPALMPTSPNPTNDTEI